MSFKSRIIGEEDLLWNVIDKNNPIIFWGAGNNARIVRRLLQGKGIVPTVYCDNNPDLWGRWIDGVEIISYNQVRERYGQYTILLTTAINYVAAIEEQLKKEKEKNRIFHMEKPFKVDDEMLEYAYFEQHIEEYERIYDMLEDDLSKEIFIENINFRLSGEKRKLISYVDGDTFFDKKLVPVNESASYVDVGAYTGDTLLRFYAFCEGKYKKIYAIEPDKGNYSGLKKLVQLGRLDNISTYNVGGWNYEGELTFYTIDNDNSDLFDSPNFFKDMRETVYNSNHFGEQRFTEEKIKVNTIDNLLGEESCDIIKINALAADFEVLQGAKETVKRYHPILVGEFGARKENLTDMLEYMLKINPDYKIFLRQKMIFGDCKTVYIAKDTI